MMCELRLRYPQVIFRSDFASGLALTPAQAVTHRSLQSSRYWPDLFIYEPREVVIKDGGNRFFSGLALELKKEGTTIKLKIGPNKGQLTSNPHIREQYFVLNSLLKRGYYAPFAVGFDEAKRYIDWYMRHAEPENRELF